MKDRNKLKVTIYISLAVLAIPLIIFLFNFKDHILSNNISDWTAFGDYFGGILNTIISFISLIILGYLTYLVSKQSSKENRRINLLVRKMDAYDELGNHILKINTSLSKIMRFTRINNKKGNLLNVEDSKNERLEVFEGLNNFSYLYYFLFSFRVRFSHLFEYDFNSKEFKNLLDEAQKIKNTMDVIREGFELKDFSSLNNLEYNLEPFTKSLALITNSLRNELKK